MPPKFAFLSRGSAAAAMGALSGWFAAASLPVMSEGATFLTVSYDPTWELHTEINDVFAERYKRDRRIWFGDLSRG